MKGAAIRKAAGLASAALFALCCHGEHPPAAPELKPAARIEVAPLGYSAPSGFYLTYRLTSASLGFFDNDHLLFTFRVGGLLKRLPGDPGDDDDQQIRAVVLDIGSGKVVQRAEWRMHDRSQYVWPFTDQKFLVRIRDSLYLTDQSLVLTPYLTFDHELRSVQVSPDRRMLVVETLDPAKLSSESASSETLSPPEPVDVAVVPTGSTKAVMTSWSRRAVVLPVMGDGLMEVLEGRQMGSWAIRNVPFQGSPAILAELKSSCQPSVQPVSASVALVLGCFQNSDDRPVDAISVKGKDLWRDRWGNRYVWGWFDYAANGSRFAYESVLVNHAVSVFDVLDTTDVAAQMVGVYDTETGKPVLVKDASPVLTAGQNVALSPDGMRFAVLRAGAIEVYDLPPVSAPGKDEPARKPGK